MRTLIFSSLLAAGVLMTSCHSHSASKTASSDTTASTQPGQQQTAATADTTATAPATPTAKGYDLSKAPVTDKPLGTFPYFSVPDGYTTSDVKKNTKDYDHFAYWLGDRFQWAEGKLYYSRISTKEGKTFSTFELRKSLGNLIEDAGGVKVFDGKINYDSLSKLPEETKVGLNDGLGDVYNDPAQEYLVHRKDKDIWIHMCIGAMGASWIVTETKPFVNSAKLLPGQ